LTLWLELSANAGIENYNKPFRGGASIWIGQDKWSIISIQEDGGSGHWQKNVGKYYIKPTFAIGGLQQTYIGAGPYIEKKIGRISLWGTYALTKHAGLVTLQFRF